MISNKVVKIGFEAFRSKLTLLVAKLLINRDGLVSQANAFFESCLLLVMLSVVGDAEMVRCVFPGLLDCALVVGPVPQL